MEYLNAREAAAMLRLNVKRVQRLARDGALPVVRVGRRWLFPRAELERMLTPGGEARAHAGVELSARNRLRGRIVSLTLDGVMAEVRLQIGAQELVSIITRSSAERLKLSVGDEVLAVIKSTEVMIGRGAG